MSTLEDLYIKIRGIGCPVRPWRVKFFLSTNKAAEYGKGERGWYEEIVDTKTSREAEKIIRGRYKIKRGLVVADRVKEE